MGEVQIDLFENSPDFNMQLRLRSTVLEGSLSLSQAALSSVLRLQIGKGRSAGKKVGEIQWWLGSGARALAVEVVRNIQVLVTYLNQQDLMAWI